MESSLSMHMALFALYAIVLLLSHELAHIAVARSYGYPVVCFSLSPLAVGLVFLDQPSRGYWILQVTFPMAVTAAITYVALFVLFPPEFATRAAITNDLAWQWGLSLLLALLTGLGDVVGMVTEMRRPVVRRERVVRDVRFMRRIRSHIRFTSFGEAYLAKEYGLSPREFLVAVVEPGSMGPRLLG